MPTVRVYTAARMQEIEDAAIVGASIVDGNLMLTRHDGTVINAGGVGTGGTGGGGLTTEQAQDLVAAMLKPGSNITLSYNDTTGELTVNSTATGSGEVTTAAVSTAGALMRSGGTMTGALTLSANGSSAMHAVTKQQLDAINANLVTLSGAQSITGVKTFTVSPVVPTATTPTQAANLGNVTDAVTDLPQLDASTDGRFDWDTSDPDFIRPLVTGVATTYPLLSTGLVPVNANSAVGPFSILSSTLTLPANSIELNTTLVEFMAMGQINNNTGSDKTITIRLRHGSVTVLALVMVVPTSTNLRMWEVSASFNYLDFIGIRPYGGGKASISVGQASGTRAVALDYTLVTETSNTITDLTAPAVFDVTAEFSAVAANQLASTYVAWLKVTN